MAKEKREAEIESMPLMEAIADATVLKNRKTVSVRSLGAKFKTKKADLVEVLGALQDEELVKLSDRDSRVALTEPGLEEIGFAVPAAEESADC